MENSFVDVFGYKDIAKSVSKVTEEVKEIPVVVEDLDEEEIEPTETKEEIKVEETPVIKEVESYESVIQTLIDDEVLAFDSEKEYDISKEGLKELLKETIDKSKVSAIDEFKKSLGNEGQELVEALSKGMSIDDYLSTKQDIDFSAIPLEDKNGEEIEQNLINLIVDYLKNVKELDDDEVEEELDLIIEKDTLMKEAERAKSHLVKWSQKIKQEKLKEAELAESIRQKELELESEKFETKVKSMSNIAGFKVSKQEAEQLYDYITKADKTGKTQFQKEDTEENRLLYALFAMKKFSKESLEKDIATQQAIKLKKQLNVSEIKGKTDLKKSDTMTTLSKIKFMGK